MISWRVFEGFRQSGDRFGYFVDTSWGVGLAMVFFITRGRDFRAKCIQQVVRDLSGGGVRVVITMFPPNVVFSTNVPQKSSPRRPGDDFGVCLSLLGNFGYILTYYLGASLSRGAF